MSSTPAQFRSCHARLGRGFAEVGAEHCGAQRVGDNPLASFNRQAGRLCSQATLSRIGSPESRIGGDPVLCRKTESGPYHDDR